MGYSRNPTRTVSSPTNAVPRHFAALDLGTNNCRLMIARRTPQGTQILDRQNRMVCLGEGLVETGALSHSAMDRAVRTLGSYAARMEGLPSLQIRAVATEACRRAINSDSFLTRVEAETGVSLEIISPREEVELAVEGCRPLLHRNRHAGQRAIVFDIGGGSTEIAWLRLSAETRTHELVGLVSLPYGVVTLSEQFSAGPSPISADERKKRYDVMVEAVQDPILDFDRIHQIGKEMRRGGVQMLGTSGTVTTLASMAQKLKRYNRYAVDGFSLSAEAAHDAIRTLRDSEGDRDRAISGLSSDRHHFMLPGCAIFDAIHRVWPAEHIVVADRGLRDGMVARMVSQSHASYSGLTRNAEYVSHRVNCTSDRSTLSRGHHGLPSSM